MFTVPSNPKSLECLRQIGVSESEAERFVRVNYSQSDIRITDSCVYNIPPNYIPSNHLFLFDLDHTLTYHHRTLFVKYADDIHLLPNRLEILRYLFFRGYTLVVFTNQATMNYSTIRERIQNFLKLVNIPIYVFASGKKDSYRKPEIGMWNHFLKLTQLSPKKLYFCGDALGREFDFADSDLEFAKRIGVSENKIFPPEIVFGMFDPKTIVLDPKQPSLIVLVGAPGSSKSTLVHSYFSSYRHISKDIQKTREMSTYLSALSERQNIIVDDTNPTIEVRKTFIEPARKLGYQINILYFVRAGQNYNEKREKKVPAIVYHIFYKKLQPPTHEEGIVTLVY